jgi:hypothetical protein
MLLACSGVEERACFQSRRQEGLRTVLENGACLITHDDFVVHSMIRDRLYKWKIAASLPYNMVRECSFIPVLQYKVGKIMVG